MKKSNNRVGHLLTFSAMSLLHVVGATSCSNAEIQEKPNVIFVLLDDLGYSQVAFNSNDITESDYDPDLLAFTIKEGNYSPEDALRFSRIASPTLNRMANSGIHFTNGYTSSNLSAASRLGIATGMQQNRWGVYRNGDCETAAFADKRLLVEHLHDDGYATAHIGKWHIGVHDDSILREARERGLSGKELAAYSTASGYKGSCVDRFHPLENGFDYYYGYNQWESPFYRATNVWEGKEHVAPNDIYSTDLFVDKALDFIDQSLDSDKPFYVQLHLHAVHDPLDVPSPERYSREFNSDSQMLNIFYSHIFAVDENMRRIEEHLKARGVDENTMIIFTSDNGGAIRYPSPMPGNAPYRGYKGSYLIGGVHVPMFIYWSGRIKKPGKNSNLVSAMDIIPTALDAAGVAIPDNIDGRSWMPYINNETSGPIRDHLVWAGVHARNWGFKKETIMPGENRYSAPFSWLVVRNDGMALQYIAPTNPGVYSDVLSGLPERYRMYNVNVDPSQRDDLYAKDPKSVKELTEIWESSAITLPPPVLQSNYEDWKSIMPKENFYIKGRR